MMLLFLALVFAGLAWWVWSCESANIIPETWERIRNAFRRD